MPVFRADDSVTHETHGSVFGAYVSPSRGSAELCAWSLYVPPNLKGVSHRPTREEVLLLLDGELRVTIDGAMTDLRRGDVALIAAGSELRVDGGIIEATAWITTSRGLEAIMADGVRFSPPWAD